MWYMFPLDLTKFVSLHFHNCRIDTAARMKGGAVRNQVYNYLEKYLPCTKQTIMVRAKKIRSQKEEAKTNKILKKLKVAVGNVMPDLLISYEKECVMVNDLKVSVNGSGKSEQSIKNPKKKFLWTDATRYVIGRLHQPMLYR